MWLKVISVFSAPADLQQLLKFARLTTRLNRIAFTVTIRCLPLPPSSPPEQLKRAFPDVIAFVFIFLVRPALPPFLLASPYQPSFLSLPFLLLSPSPQVAWIAYSITGVLILGSDLPESQACARDPASYFSSGTATFLEPSERVSTVSPLKSPLPLLHLTWTHLLSSPLLSSPHLSSPLLTSPFLSSPHLTFPLLSSPHLSSPLLTSTFLSSPLLSSPHLSSPLLISPLLSSHMIRSDVFQPCSATLTLRGSTMPIASLGPSTCSLGVFLRPLASSSTSCRLALSCLLLLNLLLAILAHHFAAVCCKPLAAGPLHTDAT
eukprot:768340-Hanusia_phi.AAC.3